MCLPMYVWRWLQQGTILSLNVLYFIPIPPVIFVMVETFSVLIPFFQLDGFALKLPCDLLNSRDFILTIYQVIKLTERLWTQISYLHLTIHFILFPRNLLGSLINFSFLCFSHYFILYFKFWSFCRKQKEADLPRGGPSSFHNWSTKDWYSRSSIQTLSNLKGSLFWTTSICHLRHIT